MQVKCIESNNDAFLLLIRFIASNKSLGLAAMKEIEC